MNIPFEETFIPCGQNGCDNGVIRKGGGIVYCRCLREFEERDSIRRMADYSNLPMDYLNSTLENFKMIGDSSVNYDTIGKVKQFVSHFDDHMKQGHGIVFMGPNNCGKTHLASAIQKMSFKKYSSYFILLTSYINLVTKSWSTRDPEDLELIDTIKRVDLLVLDDVDKTLLQSTSFKKEILDELLRSRSGNNKSVIMTTNLPDHSALTGFLGAHLMYLLQRKNYFFHLVGDYTQELSSNLFKEL